MARDLEIVVPEPPVLDGEILLPKRGKRERQGVTPRQSGARHVRTVADVAGAGPGRWRDAGKNAPSGLYLYVSPKGVRRWIFRYTSPLTRKPNEHCLGQLSLENARKRANALHQMVAMGGDPNVDVKEQRAARTTFRQAADQWIGNQAPGWRSESAMKNAKKLLHDHGEPLAKLAVNKVTADLIESALADLRAGHPKQSRRALAMFERVLDFAKAKGWRTGDNPATWRGCQQPRWPRQRNTDRPHFAAMPYQEVPEFIRELRRRQQRSSAALALEFLILCAARTGEALGARWTEIDWANGVWTLPPDRTKQGREHTVPLSDRAVELLALQRQYSNGSEFIFTGYSQNQLADKSMYMLLKDMGLECTVHGFRSSFRDWAGDTTLFPREHVEACLAHRVGNDVENSYRRLTGLEKRREIMTAWTDYCSGSEAK